MNILAIDTAGRTAGVALLRDQELLYECHLAAGLTHSETLLPMVDSALRACGLNCADIGLFGVCAGPGSFTGLRIGLAAVKGLAFAHDTPCAAVSTLAALAKGCRGQGTVIPALDARRGQVYWAAFDLESGQRLHEDEAAPAASLAQLVEQCKKPLLFVGDGAALCYTMYRQIPGVLPCPPALAQGRAACVGLVAAELYAQGLCTPPAQLLPSYHRLSQAERERAERQRAQQAADPMSGPDARPQKEEPNHV